MKLKYNESYDTHAHITMMFTCYYYSKQTLFYFVLFFLKKQLLRYSKSPPSTFPTTWSWHGSFPRGF